MLKNDEIDNIEFMFWYLNIIDIAENKMLLNRENKFSKYNRLNHYQHNILECSHRNPYICY
ncbi:MAG: hypothetical protein CBC25_00380 [Pelagibacteraceae bacterium TMED65]|nr:MAG: hypothetical protein CBC25_00380 [Pelagibacteraceae bacterium TMED65]